MAMGSDSPASAKTARGRPPAEGRDDLAVPGTDRGEGLPPGAGVERSPEERRRDDIARRAEEEAPGPLAEGRPDVLPDVEVPEHQM